MDFPKGFQVEFALEEGVTHAEATEILCTENSSKHPNGSEGDPAFAADGKSKKIIFGDMVEMSTLLGNGLMRVSKATLGATARSRIIIQTCNFGLVPPRYFLIVDSVDRIVRCQSCNHFFEEVEWDQFYLKEEACPFCQRSSAQQSVGSLDFSQAIVRETETTGSSDREHAHAAKYFSRDLPEDGTVTSTMPSVNLLPELGSGDERGKVVTAKVSAPTDGDLAL